MKPVPGDRSSAMIPPRVWTAVAIGAFFLASTIAGAISGFFAWWGLIPGVLLGVVGALVNVERSSSYRLSATGLSIDGGPEVPVDDLSLTVRPVVWIPDPEGPAERSGPTFVLTSKSGRSFKHVVHRRLPVAHPLLRELLRRLARQGDAAALEQSTGGPGGVACLACRSVSTRETPLWVHCLACGAET